METLIQRIRISSKDIGMEFNTEKCTMLVIHKRKQKQLKQFPETTMKSLRHSKLQIFLNTGVDLKEKVKKGLFRTIRY